MTAHEEKQASSLTAQAAWILIAKVTSFALAIAVPLLLARRLDQTEFGLYKQVFLIIATANALLPFGFGMSAYYFLPRETEKRGAVVLNILIFNAIVGLAAASVLFFFPNSLVWLFGDALMANFAPVLGLAIWLWIFSAFLETLVIANNEARLAMVFIVFSQLSKAVFFLAAAILFGTVSSLIWAAVLQAALQTVILFVYAKRRFPELLRVFDFGLLKRQFAYTLPFGLSGWLNTGQTDAHNYFVSRRFTPADFAIYSVGGFELPLVGILAESISSVLIPLMSRLSASEDKREIVETSARVTRKLALIYFPLYAFLFITADAFITTLFTANYQSSVPIFRLNLTLLPFAVLVLDPITRAYKEIGYFLLRLRLALFALMMPALWYATTNFGLLETSAVVVTFALTERALSTFKIARTIDFQTKDFNLLSGALRTAFATVLAAAALFAFYYLTNENLKLLLSGTTETVFHNQKLSDFLGGAMFLAICGAVFAAIYLVLINLFGAIEPEDKQKLTNLLQKFFRFRKPEPDLRFEI
ncbi:MAG TPA: oligosaccharide flippase family protein [Pyrinomonadaceae bacterium]|jgi:O-antigen/teichoic acid export membrane protein